jgi:hypothetical protein
VAHAIPLLFERRDIHLDRRGSELARLKAFSMSWTLGDPLSELAENAEVGINGRSIFLREPRLMILIDPDLRSRQRKGNDL